MVRRAAVVVFLLLVICVAYAVWVVLRAHETEDLCVFFHSSLVNAVTDSIPDGQTIVSREEVMERFAECQAPSGVPPKEHMERTFCDGWGKPFQVRFTNEPAGLRIILRSAGSGRGEMERSFLYVGVSIDKPDP